MVPSHGAAPARVTLAQIAAACGVATSTVSRALANPGRVNPVTRRRVHAAALELGYQGRGAGYQTRAAGPASALDSPLSTGIPGGGPGGDAGGSSTVAQRGSAAGQGRGTRARIVAVVVSDLGNPFYYDLIRGTHLQLKAAGFQQLLIDTEESDEYERGVLTDPHRSFAGAILTSSRLSDRQLIEASHQLPLVALNRRTRGVPNVVIDTPGGMEQAVAHLASLGHRRLAYASGPEKSWANESRWRAILRAGSRFGVLVERIGPFEPNIDGGAGAADGVLASGATACIAFNDILAMGMLRRLQGRGLRVPEDLSIIGCDDMFGADFSAPTLTTLSAPTERAARAAAAILISKLAPDTRPPRSTAVVPTHLTIRGSTGPAPRTT